MSEQEFQSVMTGLRLPENKIYSGSGKNKKIAFETPKENLPVEINWFEKGLVTEPTD
jgi:hypothetical protein